MKIYPEKLSEVLKDKSITQRELADRLGLTETTISRYMNETSEPSRSVVFNIANILGVRPSLFSDYKTLPRIKIDYNETDDDPNSIEEFEDDDSVVTPSETFILPKFLKNTSKKKEKDLQEDLINETMSFWKDTDLRIIQRARAKMNNKDKERMMIILKTAFDDAFKDIEE